VRALRRIRLLALPLSAVLVVACGESSRTSSAPSTGPAVIGATAATTTSAAASNVSIAPGATTAPGGTPADETVPSSAGPTPPPSTQTPESTGDACIEALPIAYRAAQVVMPAVYGDTLAASTKALAGTNIGGVILMTWPAGTDPAALAALKATASPPVMVATDEEGGSVQRLKALGVLPSEAKVAATMTPDAARTMIAEHAVAVRALGVDVVLGPVVDVGPVTGTGPIGSRAFSNDPAIVATYAAAYVDGWQSAGILPVLKHFPGHGSATGDSHTGRVSTPPLEQLAVRDLTPYQALADRHPGVLVGHLDVPGLTDADQKPASLSPAAISGLLRDQLGYSDALVFTDALGMDAISSRWSVPDAAVLSLVAGSDVVLFTSFADTPAVIAAIEAAVADGTLSPTRLDNAVGHVLAAKQVDPCSLHH
jgi:beta-N-acetylhexosaminidase